MEKFYAHSAPDSQDESNWQPLAEHLHNVAQLASERAKIFGAESLVYLIGLLHDLGKYSKEFQERLHGAKRRADHATAGAKIIFEYCKEHVPNVPKSYGEKLGRLLAFTIAGHHAGLANGERDGLGRSTLEQRLALKFGDAIPLLNEVWKQEIKLPEHINFISNLKKK